MDSTQNNISAAQLLGGKEHVAQSVWNAIVRADAGFASAFGAHRPIPLEWLQSTSRDTVLDMLYAKRIALSDAIGVPDDVLEQWWKNSGLSPTLRSKAVSALSVQMKKGIHMRVAALDCICRKSSDLDRR